MSVSYIYIIGGDNPPYKVGISRDPEKRLKSLQTGHPQKLRIHLLKQTDSTKTKLLESAIHHNMKFYRTHGEWFDMPLDKVCSEVEFALIRYEDDPLLSMKVKGRWL